MSKCSLDVVLSARSSSSFNDKVYYQKFCTYSEQRKNVKESSCRDHYKRHAVIFDLTWVPGDDNDDDDDGSFNFLAGCTSRGEIIVWKIPLFNNNHDHDHHYDPTIIQEKAIFRKQICQGKLYSIRSEILIGGTKRLLIVSGDDGVLIFDWENDILKTLLLLQNSTADSSNSAVITPTQRFHPYPSPLESRGVEINDVQLLKQNGDNAILFGAAGDSFGIYKWDMESGQLLKNYTSPGSGYIHSIAIVPNGNNSSSSSEDNHYRPASGSTLLAGSEGGRLEFWDVHQDKSMARIDLTTVSGADASSSSSSSSTTTGITGSTTTTTRSNNKRAKTLPRWISSVCAYDPNWFTVAGGNSSGLRGGINNTGGGGGFLATYHQPTRSLVSWTDTREVPQHLTRLPSPTSSLMGGSSSSSSSVEHTLLSVANEGVVSHFNALSLDVTRRQWCSPPSAYAAAVSGDGRYTAVGGVGSLVDIFDSTGEKWLTVSVC